MNGKLREALTKVSDVLETWCDHLPPIIQDEAKEALALADEAFAEPPRNCDVGTAEEQYERFKNFCLSYYEPCNVDGECWRCPLFKTKTRCPIAWSQMPYEAKESEVKK